MEGGRRDVLPGRKLGTCVGDPSLRAPCRPQWSTACVKRLQPGAPLSCVEHPGGTWLSLGQGPVWCL